MRFRNPLSPAEAELRAWAYDATADAPTQDWELVLSWQVDRDFLGRCVEYASDPDCPKAEFFLGVLYQWVDTVGREERFEFLRAMYDGWLEVARGVTDPGVKRWRHQARLVFEGVIPFEREKWWAGSSETRQNT